MKRILIYIVLSLLLVSCSDGIKNEAMGMFLLPGINYGDDVEKLIDNGVVQLKHLSPEGKYYSLNATVYGYDFSKGKDVLSVITENGKIIDVSLSAQIPYEIYTGDEMPAAIKMAMTLEDELTTKIGTPTKIQELNFIYKTEETKLVWKKNGLKYELRLTPGPQNIFWEINYSVESSKDDV